MVKEIVFHLGDRKTGSTSIQTILARKAWSSQRHSLIYPAQFNHIPLAKSLSAPRERQFEGARFGKVRAALDASEADYGVISAEDFEYVAPKAVQAAIEQHFPAYAGRIRLVAYVRPHAARLLSAFAERAKKGVFNGSLEAFHDEIAKTQMLYYAPRFEKWRAVFGDQFTLRPFVRDQLHQGDVVQDFFRYLFQDDGFEITGPTRENESLSVEDVAMMRAIHRHLRALGGKYLPEQQAFGWYMASLLGAEPYPGGGTKPQVHKALAEKLVATYAADAAALDAEFFDGTPISDALVAAPGKAPETAQSFMAKTHFKAPARRQFKVWAQLLHRMIEADPKHFGWAVRTPETRSDQPPSTRGTRGNGGTRIIG